ncbi:folylpolyglutamate synthase-like [Vicia villosa]|uniref:folylpolyglutamate synthase-like n=1 Tax=Vicia villosa TaxID=3911 RepID=UPI00273CF2BE|nr:folylpolyglutamate synthase-like [Vicia villosa]
MVVSHCGNPLRRPSEGQDSDGAKIDLEKRLDVQARIGLKNGLISKRVWSLSLILHICLLGCKFFMQIFLFNCMSVRDPQVLLPHLMKTCVDHGDAMFSSLLLVINWLKDSLQQNHSTRFKVLITGSIHLVSDLLKLIKK